MNITEILTDVEYNSKEQIIETKIGEAICLISFEMALWHNEVGTFIAEAIKEKVERDKAKVNEVELLEEEDNEYDLDRTPDYYMCMCCGNSQTSGNSCNKCAGPTSEQYY